MERLGAAEADDRHELVGLLGAEAQGGQRPSGIASGGGSGGGSVSASPSSADLIAYQRDVDAAQASLLVAQQALEGLLRGYLVGDQRLDARVVGALQGRAHHECGQEQVPAKR